MIVFPSPFALAWPDHRAVDPQRHEGVDLEIGEAMTTEFASDAHFAAYESPSRRRLSLRAAPPVMRWLVFDVDAPDHASSDEWRAQLAATRLPGDPLGYFTRGGARFVYSIERPAGESWAAFYLWAGVELSRAAGVIVDPVCCDWTRLFRVPHATRDGVLQRHPTICGDAHAPGAWPELRSDDRLDHLVALALMSPAWRSKLPRLMPPKPRPIVRAAHGSTSGAIRFAVDHVLAARAGDRNAELFRRTKFLAQLVQRGELHSSQVERDMLRAALSIGLTHTEAQRTIASALRVFA